MSETLTRIRLLKAPMGALVVLSEKVPLKLVEGVASGQWQQSKWLWTVR